MPTPARHFALVPLAYALLAATAALPERAHAGDTPVVHSLESFSIAAGPLADTLLAISRQTHTPISFDQAALDGLTSAPIEGQLSRDQAIDHALQRSGLRAHYTASGAIVISQDSSGASARPKPAAQHNRSATPAGGADPVLATVVTLGTRR